MSFESYSGRAVDCLKPFKAAEDFKCFCFTTGLPSQHLNTCSLSFHNSTLRKP